MTLSKETSFPTGEPSFSNDFVPPEPLRKSKFALLGGLLSKDGRSMLDLLPRKAYKVLMGTSAVRQESVFVINAPDTVREVMSGRSEVFPKHRFLVEILQPLIGVSLFNANGEDWQRQRRMVEAAFTHASLREAFPTMIAAIQSMIQRIDGVKDGDIWHADIEMSHVTADIIFRTILATKLDDRHSKDVCHAFSEYQRYAQRIMGLSALGLPTWFHRRKCRQAGLRVRSSFASLVDQRHSAAIAGQSCQPNDMLGALLAARDPQTGMPFNADELVNQVATLFLAGHETSASTLAWALYILACQPAWQDHLRNEINKTWPDGCEPSFGDTKKLSLVHDHFRETLRLYPPIPFLLRESSQVTELRGKCASEGSMVAVSPWLIHRHELFWSRPSQFDPSRFDTEDGKVSAKCHYLPFGLGERSCPGAAFATQEGILILAMLIRRYKFEPVKGHVPKPVAILTLKSSNGIRLRVFPVE